MKIIKYIFSCIIGCFDAWVGADTNNKFKDYFIGLVSIFILISLFFVSFFFLEKKTNINFKTNILCSIGLTILLIGVILIIIIFIEKIFL